MTAPEKPNGVGPELRAGARRIAIIISGCTGPLAAAIRRVARWTLREEGRCRGRLDIAVVGEHEMRRQNGRWLGRRSTTDVLAFDLGDRPRDGWVDGQLVLCDAVARRRARERKVDWRGELLLYVVHGCLHLCGYTDGTPSAAAKMHRREDEILVHLGWGPVYSSRGPAGRARRTPARSAARQAPRQVDSRAG